MIGATVGLRAVLFDAGNTLLFLDHERMAAAVGEALGLPLTGPGLAAGGPEAARAMETARATDQVRSAAYLEALFLQAGVAAGQMGQVGETLERLHAERHLWCVVADDAHAVLDQLRASGLRLGVVSNSDGRVDEALRAAGIRRYFDVVIDSTHAGVEKPDPAIFRSALTALGVRPSEACYVGDLYEVDVVGARAAGIPAVLLAPGGDPPPPPCHTVGSLRDLAAALLKETLAS